MSDATPVRRFCRIMTDGTAQHGEIIDGTIHVLSAAPWLGGTPTGVTLPDAGARKLAPVVPQKILCVGRNYRSHLGDRPEPSEPGIFVKLANALADPGDAIPLPTVPGADGQPLKIDTEGELVVVMGRRARNISPQDARDAIFGLTCGHDISVRPWQRGDLQWTRAKSSDLFAPLGPEIVTGVSDADLLLETRVNGAVQQSERTSMMIYDVPTVIAYITAFMTLEPGDVIMTGTPGTAPQIAAGDEISVTVEHVGTLTNTLVAEPGTRTLEAVGS